MSLMLLSKDDIKQISLSTLFSTLNFKILSRFQKFRKKNSKFINVYSTCLSYLVRGSSVAGRALCFQSTLTLFGKLDRFWLLQRLVYCNETVQLTKSLNTFTQKRFMRLTRVDNVINKLIQLNSRLLFTTLVLGAWSPHTSVSSPIS
jgi:hypothetical protein